jgi:hypothetical protein
MGAAGAAAHRSAAEPSCRAVKSTKQMFVSFRPHSLHSSRELHAPCSRRGLRGRHEGQLLLEELHRGRLASLLRDFQQALAGCVGRLHAAALRDQRLQPLDVLGGRGRAGMLQSRSVRPVPQNPIQQEPEEQVERGIPTLGVDEAAVARAGQEGGQEELFPPEGAGLQRGRRGLRPTQEAVEGTLPA